MDLWKKEFGFRCIFGGNPVLQRTPEITMICNYTSREYQGYTEHTHIHPSISDPWETWGQFYYKDCLSGYGDSHHISTTVVRPSDLYMVSHHYIKAAPLPAILKPQFSNTICVEHFVQNPAGNSKGTHWWKINTDWWKINTGSVNRFIPSGEKPLTDAL